MLGRRGPQQVGGGQLVGHQGQAGIRRRSLQIGSHHLLLGLDPSLHLLHQTSLVPPKKGQGVGGADHGRAAVTEASNSLTLASLPDSSMMRAFSRLRACSTLGRSSPRMR